LSALYPCRIENGSASELAIAQVRQSGELCSGMATVGLVLDYPGITVLSSY
jgi:hypothetical protein